MKKVTNNALPELLAPAGSMETFHAAIQAGANAVYLGLDQFNARIRAKNFTVATLSYLIPFAHKQGIKVYITLNTVIKQQELSPLLDLLYQLEQLGVDGLIIQDTGLLHLAQQHFPGVPLHASTQMNIHNSLGVKTAKKLGLSRVILSRELSLQEISTIRSQNPSMELELFIHGALCYSISGLCLASSYLGGFSGNRGRCTQVCRRRFYSSQGSGFYFSPRDFWAIEAIQKYKELGIASLKIEGRMRGAQYVYSVVKAYRHLLDHPESITNVKEELLNDFGRPKSSFFLQGMRVDRIIDAVNPAGTGNLLGTVKSCGPKQLTIETETEIFTNDKIRIHSQDGLEGQSLTVLEIAQTKKAIQLQVNKQPEARKGDRVYLTARKKGSPLQKYPKKLPGKPIYFKKNYPHTKRVLNKFLQRKNSKKAYEKVYLRINNLNWIPLVKNIPCDGLIIQCHHPMLQQITNQPRIFSKNSQNIMLALPPYIAEHDLPQWKKAIASLIHNRYNSWMCGQLGQLALFSRKQQLYADASIWCTNRSTQEFLFSKEFSHFYYSPEDDILNLKATSHTSGFITLFGFVPLFISKIKPVVKLNDCIQDNRHCSFFAQKFDNLYYLLGEKPLCLTHRRDKLKALGISHFVLDLSFCPPRKKTLKTVLSHYNNKSKIPETTLVNHKGGLQ